LTRLWRKRPPVELIKLDIEGGELAALRGAQQIIAKHKPALIFECGPEPALAQHNLSRQDLV
jgi:FkbM family methyltransferase